MKTKYLMITSILLMSFVMLIAGCAPVTAPSKSISTSTSQSGQSSKIFASSSTVSMSSNVSSATSSVSSSASASVSASTSGTSGSTDQMITGTFVKLEWGDYLHVIIKGEDNAEHSYFVIGKINIEPDTLVAGQKVRITWHNADTYLAQVSQTFNIDEATKIEIIG